MGGPWCIGNPIEGLLWFHDPVRVPWGNADPVGGL